MRIARQAGTLQVFALALMIVAGAFTIVINNRSLPATALSADPLVRLQSGAHQQTTTKTEHMIWTLQDRIRRSPNHVDSYALLGAAYVQQARETGDPSYYGKAQSVLDEAQKRDRQHIDMLVGQGSLALARHDFRAALALGEQAQALNPTVPRIYGVVGDAQIELGMYEQAVQTIQTMVDLRPDLSSYTRVAYLRELHGDIPGAIEAMQAALSAGGPTGENTEWTRVQLGNLYFNAGDLRAAEHQYQRALSLLPDYVPALVSLAHVHAAEGRFDEAIRLLTDATQRMPLPEYVIALGDVYTRQGNRELAREQYALVEVIDKLFASNGVNTDLEIALFMADHDRDLPASLQKARAAYAARPSIHAADVVAWTLYKSGQYVEAQRYSEEALKLGTHDGLKLFHGAMIARALGQHDLARTYLQQAVDTTPHFSLLYSEQATETLQQLVGTTPQRSK